MAKVPTKNAKKAKEVFTVAPGAVPEVLEPLVKYCKYISIARSSNDNNRYYVEFNDGKRAVACIDLNLERSLIVVSQYFCAEMDFSEVLDLDSPSRAMMYTAHLLEEALPQSGSVITGMTSDEVLNLVILKEFTYAIAWFFSNQDTL
jgi:hypothetical protein